MVDETARDEGAGTALKELQGQKNPNRDQLLVSLAQAKQQAEESIG